MIQAVWQGKIIAQSDKTIVVEGNQYFPPEDVMMDYLEESDTHTTCPWKGFASYKNIHVGDTVLEDGCWYYPEPKPEAARIRGYFAFWKGVEVR